MTGLPLIHVRFNRVAGDESTETLNLMELGAHDAHAQLLAQIAGNDLVHTYGAQTVDELREYRIGGPGFSKTAYALVDDREKVLSVIFGYNTDILPNDVSSILREKANTPKAKTAMRAFYSISSLAGGGGSIMIPALVGNCPPDLIPVTLSPARSKRHSIRKLFPQFANATLSTEEKTVLGFLYWLSCTDDVQTFHQGNGAGMLQINPDGNTPDSVDGREAYGIMFNYGYIKDKEQRRLNGKLFRAVKAKPEKIEHLLKLTDLDLAERVIGLMRQGVLKELHGPTLLSRLEKQFSILKSADEPAFKLI